MAQILTSLHPNGAAPIAQMPHEVRPGDMAQPHTGGREERNQGGEAEVGLNRWVAALGWGCVRGAGEPPGVSRHRKELPLKLDGAPSIVG